jgi:hypothetical protein
MDRSTDLLRRDGYALELAKWREPFSYAYGKAVEDLRSEQSQTTPDSSTAVET